MFANIFKRLLKTNSGGDSYSDVQIGAAGEVAATDYLREQGYRIVERNWRCSIGEIDLIAIQDQEYVFVEVKTSRKLGSLPPEFRVQRHKKRKLQSLANAYLKSHSIASTCRIDVISVWWENHHVKIRHIPNAFNH